MADASLEFEELPPDASSLAESLRAFNYTLPTAIADLVDNSITAGARNIWLDFHWEGANSTITVSDDGRGMTEAELVQCMRLGSRNPLQDRDANDLGRFGLGLKTASFSQCRRVTVCSRASKLGNIAARTWDLDHLAQAGSWQLLKSGMDESSLTLRRIAAIPPAIFVVANRDIMYLKIDFRTFRD